MTLKELKCITENINLEEYIELRELVKQNMPHPDWLGDFSKEDIKKMLEQNSKIWIYYRKKQPICSMMLIPAEKKSLIKFGLDLDYQVVADYGPMFVHPNYVGNALQIQMLETLDEYCKTIGYQYAASTVHPENLHSIYNLEKDGFELQGQKILKRGPRNIYVKKYKKTQN